tara:strand:+ start:288 stop:398 length:111 start_codon:yes stop_codon:yes gene_type:complete
MFSAERIAGERLLAAAQWVSHIFAIDPAAVPGLAIG